MNGFPCDSLSVLANRNSGSDDYWNESTPHCDLPTDQPPSDLTITPTYSFAQ